MITASEFESHFRTYFDQLYRLANSMLGDNEESRDVVHEVFAQLWETQPTIESSKMQDYLKRATCNRCLNLIKHNTRFEALRTSYVNELKYSLQSEKFDWELWNQIQNFIQTEMPPRTQQAMNLCFGEKMSYKEAASRMGIGVDAINKHIVAGLRLLREKFKNKNKLL